MSDFTNLNKTIWSIFDPVLNFFQQVWDYISSFLAFLWDIIEWLYYWFNTIISHVWNVVDWVFGYSFFADNLFVVSWINWFLWSDAWNIIVSLFFVWLLLVLLRFIFWLIPFFKK